jgi:hypothetical protein
MNGYIIAERPFVWWLRTYFYKSHLSKQYGLLDCLQLLKDELNGALTMIGPIMTHGIQGATISRIYV